MLAEHLPLWPHSAGVAEMLRAAGVTAVDVAGVALDVCVTATCLDTALAGFSPVTILEDAVAPTSDKAGQQAWPVLAEAGVHRTTCVHVLNTVD